MEFGLFTCPYQFGQIEQAFKDAVDFSYDFIELWGGRPHAYSYDIESDVSSILQLVDKYAMPVKVYTPEHNAYPFNYMLGDDLQWQSSMDYLVTGLKTAGKLGCDSMLISVGNGGMKSPECRKERLMKSLRYLNDAACRLDQKIIVETLTQYESNTCTKLSELEEVLKEVDSEYLLPMVDLAAPFLQGEDPADYVKTFGKKLSHIHLVDSNGEDETHLIPGEGIMDIKSIIRRMQKYGFDGTATIELVTHYISDPTYYAGEAIRKAKEILL